MTPTKRLPHWEFVALVAMMFAMIAFAVDTMLPALPDIGRALSPESPNRAQFVVSSFVLGMGIGTLLVGPISDAFGRRVVILSAIGIYILGAVIAWQAQSLEVMVFARILQGLGAAGPRAVGLAIVRDLYEGRQMARIMSFAMIIFSLVPAIGPLFGSWIIAMSDWRTIFLAFVVFALVVSGWFGFRQGESLPVRMRRPLGIRSLFEGVSEVFSNRIVIVTTGVLTLCLAVLFSTLVSTQPIFEQMFDRAESFPRWFALIAVLSMAAPIVNAVLVVRLGMRLLVSVTLMAQVVFAGFMVVSGAMNLWPEVWYFAAFIAWSVSIFSMAGLTIGNLNALALEPMGHIAGLAASLVSSVATVLSVMVAVPVGLAFDGTPVPLAVGVFACSLLGTALMRLTR